MRNQGLGSWIERRARMSPERVALVAGDRSWTYGELATHVAGVAGALEENGVRWGDRVCYVGPNHPAALTTAFAAGLLGAVYAPLSHRRPPAELQSIVADAGCAVVLYGPDAERRSPRCASARRRVGSSPRPTRSTTTPR